MNTEEVEDKYFVYATAESDDDTTQDLNEEEEVILKPILKNNSGLKVEEVTDGLDFPTSMAFLGPYDILVMEKNEGTVRRIINGVMLERPLLNVDVASEGERGMLGIAIAREEKDSAIEENNKELVDPKLLLDLPATPWRTHNGGKIVIGPDDNVYLTIGDAGDHDASNPSNIINVQDGPDPDGRAGILRVTQDGNVVEGIEREGEEDSEDSNILGNEYPVNLYYAYGIWNSFGMDFDPITGKLWDVETGRNFGEEINLVEPGFNSGWMKAQGIWELDEMLRAKGIASPNDDSFMSQLVDFNGRGQYSSPEFTWGKMPVTTSGMAFFHSDRLGKQYEHDLFVGEFVGGMIFDFNLNEDRTQLSFDNKGLLEDKVADGAEELEEVIFGYGFGGITDIKIGPYDGYLYVLSLDRGGDECKPQYPDRACIPYSSKVEGHIFRVIPAAT